MSLRLVVCTAMAVLGCASAVAVDKAAKPEAEKVEPQPLVEYPYTSLYYSNPTVKPGEKVEIPFFVTDWNNTKVRRGDDSKRFDVMIKFGPSGGPYETRTRKGVPSGDHAFTIGPFACGDYECFVWTKDLQNGLESHRVWHEFRVRTEAELAIPESKTYRMTEADLVKYGIVPEREGLFREVFVPTANRKVAICETNMPKNVSVPADGYVTFVPCDKDGERQHDTWLTAKTVYGSDYDAAKMALVATNNTTGLQKLLDDKKAEGFRKLVLLKRIYRVVHAPSIDIPTEFTLDFNQATVKLNGFAGPGCFVFRIRDAYDSHIVNGTLAGDYYEHDYAHSPNKAEWVNGICIDGDSHYSSVENMLVTHITGYATTVGMGGRGTNPDCKAGVGMMGKPTDGGLDLATGEVVPAAGRYTGTFVDISNFGTNKLCVSHRLDPIRGLVSRSWCMPIAFYDGEKKFISGEVACLYRPLAIPPGAKFARVTVETATQLAARQCDLALQFFRLPSLCAFRNNRFYLNRSTSHVPFVCREVITEDNVFEHSGETLTHCAIDAEDGWEGLHDFYLRRNKFLHVPLSSIILNAGMNLVVDENVGSISVRERVVSPCIRSNDCTAAVLLCGRPGKGSAGHEHTMHGRYIDNSFGSRLTIGGGRREGSGFATDGWTIALAGTKVIGDPVKRMEVEQGASAEFRDVTFENCAFGGGYQHFVGCTFRNCTFTYPGSRGNWRGCTIENCTFLGSTSNVLTKCTLKDSVFATHGGGFIALVGCTLENVTSRFQYWAAPARIGMASCTVKGTNSLWNVGSYEIGRFAFRNTKFNCGRNPVVRVGDTRTSKNTPETETGVISAEGCEFASPLYAVQSGECTSKRPIVVGVAKCRFASGVKAGSKLKPMENWKDLTDAEWTAYCRANGRK